jgi:acetyltransferase
VALDARVVVYDKDFKAEDLPKIAVRPYPHQYVGKWTTRDGLELLIRPIRPEDEPLIVEMHKTLSEASVYMRYFHAMKLSQRVAHDRLLRICHTDYAREIALVAEMTDPQTGKKAIIGVARLSRVHGTQDAEFSLIVNDAYHRRGIGTELLRRLLEVGRDEKVDRVMADVLPANYPMQRVCDKLGFEVQSAIDADLVKVAIRLQ